MHAGPRTRLALMRPMRTAVSLRSEDPTQDCVAIAGRPQGTYSVMESTEAQSIRLRASSYRPASIGQPVSTFHEHTV